MKRRGFLQAIGAGATLGTAGCLGMGGEAIISIQQSVRVDPENGWVKEIPDMSDSGGALSYRVRSSDRQFDVYFFLGDDQYEHYETYIKGREPSETPAGHEAFSKVAMPQPDAESTYQAATEDDGARESIDVAGPYYFVVDHSSYRMENRVDEYGEPLSAFVDLEVIENKL